jgi:hypothetical protein
MNERIRELAEQAGAVFTNSHAASLLDDEMEKFAELIVQKCADISNQAEKQCQHPGTQILKHFGVEL